MTKFLLKSEAKQLVAALHKGREYRQATDNTIPNLTSDDILDIISWAKRIRQLNAELTLVEVSKAYIDLIDGKPSIIYIKE